MIKDDKYQILNNPVINLRKGKIEAKLPLDNIISVKFDFNKIHKLFKAKVEEKLENKTKYKRGMFYSILYSDLQSHKRSVRSELYKTILYKLYQALALILEEWIITKPNSEEENIIFQEYIHKVEKDIFGHNVEESLAEILADCWYRGEELFATMVLDKSELYGE